MENGVSVTTKGYQQPDAAPVWKIILVASIAAGIQFGWALQLSLLTPYVQMLGLPHAAASFIWLCGPVSGMLVQPIVGYHSDKCMSSFGRRRPFIAAGAGLVVVAVFLIGFAADIGHSAGDVLTRHTKPRAVATFVVGFWILDVANNMLQGPCRAFLADLSGGNPRKMSSANAWFSFFMAVGNVLGYSAGSYSHLWKIFPFSKTEACDIFCANLKSCFFFSITLLLILTITALSIVKEPDSAAAAAYQLTKIQQRGIPVFGELFSAIKNLNKPMWLLMLVTALNWIAWFPFLLYDTDWMGREVYGGRVGEPIYDTGVRAGSIGLMLNSVVLAFSSLVVLVLARGANAAKRLWFGVNILFAICLAMTILVTRYADHLRRFGPDGSVLPPVFGVKASALAIFAIAGIPLSVTFSIPFALASIYCTTSDAGQGLSLGLLNISICIPQMIVSVSSGPLDSLFGGGNLPAFVLGAVAATISAILALVLLPSKKSDKPLTITGGFH